MGFVEIICHRKDGVGWEGEGGGLGDGKGEGMQGERALSV